MSEADTVSAGVPPTVSGAAAVTVAPAGGPIASDAGDVRRARHAPGLLRAFNDAGVLAAADVHVARRLGELAGESEQKVLLGIALAVRAPRLGHVCVDLATIRETATPDTDQAVDLSALPWPEPEQWTARLAASPLVAAQDAAGECPLRLEAPRLYLDRYWREERAVARDLRTLAGASGDEVAAAWLADGLARHFGAQVGSRQALACACALLSRLSVVAGGPGTGKTTTVARIVALLLEHAESAGAPPPLVGLAAPTGKAAARLAEAVHAEAGRMDLSEGLRERMLALDASTLHRLLGSRPDSRSRFRHDRRHRLPHDVVVVDETSMVGLSLMARLAEAVRPGARLVLVGDPDQLSSIEAGAVLGDVVGPARDALRMRADAVSRLGEATGRLVDAAAGDGFGDGIVLLDRGHRFGGAIATLAEAIRRGDADRVVEVLRTGSPEVRWLQADPADAASARILAPLREGAIATGVRILDAARAGRASRALAALGAFRVLCAHRRGPYGVEAWTGRIEAWLAEASGSPGFADPWQVGRPLLVTENDYGLGLFNGDTGVIVAARDGLPVAAFERRGAVDLLRPSRLGAVETVYAMTIHKSQGSQLRCAGVVLPDASSPLLTRELLYTAVTRAQEKLLLAGTEEAVRRAVARPVARASGLRARLWGEG